MATKRKLSLNTKIFAAIIILFAALMLFSGGIPQTAKYSQPYIKLWELKEYPAPFMVSGNYQGILVVGADAPASDVIAATDIASAIVAPLPNSTTMVAKLDTEVLISTKDKTTNLILVGSSKVNRVIADVQGVKYNATIGVSASYANGSSTSGRLILRPSKYSWSKTILTVEGDSAIGTRNVASILKDYKTYKSKGLLFGRNCDVYTSGGKVVLTCHAVPSVWR